MEVAMNNRKLYIFEGIPGSGKTTSASWLSELLMKEQGSEVLLYLEGNPKHPADFESVACLTDSNYQKILKMFPVIDSLVERKGNWFFIPYGQLEEKDPELVSELRKFDVYELPVEDFCEVTLLKWKEFVQKAVTEEKIYVFECCFLQNPFTYLLAKHNISTEVIFKHITKLAESIAELNPIIYYFEQDDIEESINRVRKERPIEWFEFLTWYYTGQEYGRARGISGESGVLHFLEDRKRLEKEVLANIPVKSVVINNSQFDWDRCKQRILATI
jgi:DNA polymerase III delta prime subunit